GDFDEAERFLEEGLTVCRGLYPTERGPRCAWFLGNLGGVLSGLGRRREALEDVTAALAEARRAYGEGHSSGVLLTSLQADLLLDGGAIAAAGQRMDAAFALMKRLPEPLNDSLLAGLELDAGRVRLAQGDIAAADALLRSSLARRRRLTGDHDLRPPGPRTALRDAALARGARDEAAARVAAARADLVPALPPAHPWLEALHAVEERLRRARG